MLEQFKAARRSGTPLVTIETPDQHNLIRMFKEGLNGNAGLVEWDSQRGLRPINGEGVAVLALMLDKTPEQIGDTTQKVDIGSLLERSLKMPKGAVLFIHNAYRFVESAGMEQALCNARDVLKSKPAVVCLLSPPGTLRLPAAIAGDAYALHDPLPNEEQIATLIEKQFENIKKPLPAKGEVDKIAGMLMGLNMFAAEQTIAMNLDAKTGAINMAGLWDLKREMIEANQGLSIYKGMETFADVVGVENGKEVLSDDLTGKLPPRCIVFIDEIEKDLAGSSGDAQDNTGVSQAYLKALLVWMQNKKVIGVLLYGVPGSSKSLLAKAAGNQFGVPLVEMNLGAAKDSKLGASEKIINRNLEVIDSISGGRVMLIATCNSVQRMPSELLRRFTRRIYFDLPSKEHCQQMFKHYLQKYELPEQAVPDCTNWTGYEVAQCCEMAWRSGKTLLQVQNRIVPVARSMGKGLDDLRDSAHGAFLDAYTPGLYMRPSAKKTEATGKRGRLED